MASSEELRKQIKEKEDEKNKVKPQSSDYYKILDELRILRLHLESAERLEKRDADAGDNYWEKWD